MQVDPQQPSPGSGTRVRRRPRLECLEIWGGTGALDEAASVYGLDFSVYSEPHCRQGAGGDIFLASMCGAGNVARFLLADVAGHGVAVNELAESLRELMRRHIGTLDQTEIARDLNREFSDISTQGRFATAALATYYAPEDRLMLVSAGHPPPLLYRAGPALWQVLSPDADTLGAGVAPSNLPFGIVPQTDYGQLSLELTRGDLVVLYSDAWIEARDASGRQLGVAGLLALARALDPRDTAGFPAALRAAVADFTGGRDPDDDATLLVLHHNAARPPAARGGALRALALSMGLAREGGEPT